MDKSPHNSRPRIIFTRTLSIAFMIIGAFIMFMSFAATTGLPKSLNIIKFIFAAYGAAFFIIGILLKAKIQRFKNYIDLITNHNITSFDKIAQNTNRSPKYVERDIKAMIRTRLFVNAYIENGSIIIKGIEPIEKNTSSKPGSAEVKIVICNSCGAKNRVTVGTVEECEYCGAPISTQ